MSEDQPLEIKWRYFGRDSATASIYQIYRCPSNGKRIAQQALIDVAAPWGFSPVRLKDYSTNPQRSKPSG
jgi:hypothetical protein